MKKRMRLRLCSVFTLTGFLVLAGCLKDPRQQASSADQGANPAANPAASSGQQPNTNQFGNYREAANQFRRIVLKRNVYKGPSEDGMVRRLQVHSVDYAALETKNGPFTGRLYYEFLEMHERDDGLADRSLKKSEERFAIILFEYRDLEWKVTHFIACDNTVSPTQAEEQIRPVSQHQEFVNGKLTGNAEGIIRTGIADGFVKY